MLLLCRLFVGVMIICNEQGTMVHRPSFTGQCHRRENHILLSRRNHVERSSIFGLRHMLCNTRLPFYSVYPPSAKATSGETILSYRHTQQSLRLSCSEKSVVKSRAQAFVLRLCCTSDSSVGGFAASLLCAPSATSFGLL